MDKNKVYESKKAYEKKKRARLIYIFDASLKKHMIFFYFIFYIFHLHTLFFIMYDVVRIHQTSIDA